jgi:8-oxo-dGTP diphosphatase
MKEDTNPNKLRVINRDIVSALIFSADRKILMGKKDSDKGGVYKDTWHIPGGGVDEGETKMEALAREIQEEVGINIDGKEILLVDDEGSGASEKLLKDSGERVWCEMRFSVYKVHIEKDADDIEIVPGNDLPILKWIDIEELNQYKLTPPSEILFKKLGLIS